LPLRPLLTPYKINRLKIKFCFKIAHFGHFLTFSGIISYREIFFRKCNLIPESGI